MKRFPRATLRKGVSLLEILLGIFFLTIIYFLILFLIRATSTQEKSLVSVNAFHLQTGTILEQIKQDLRSVKELNITPSRIEVVRYTGIATTGEISEEKISFSASGSSILEKRGNQTKDHSFLSILNPVSAKLKLSFGLSPPKIEIDLEKSTIMITLLAQNKEGNPFASLISSTSIEIKAKKISFESSAIIDEITLRR